MRTIQGIAASPGVAVGKAYVFDPQFRVVRRRVSPANLTREVDRFRAALEATGEDLAADAQRVREALGDDLSGIFDFHLAILQDPELARGIEETIRKRRTNAERAVHDFLRARVSHLATVNPKFAADRAHDFHDLEIRLLQRLMGPRWGQDLADCPPGGVVVALNLTPAQTITLDPGHVAGFVTVAGARTSHTAILARSLGIPAVVGVPGLLEVVIHGSTVVIDGTTGTVVARPTKAALARYRERQRSFVQFAERLHIEVADLPVETRDGYELSLLANIEFPDEIDAALRNGATGVGLYRTEYLLAGRTEAPSEDEQVEAYVNARERLGDLPLVVRTWDFGADKGFPGALAPEESNPFLGCRSLRLCFRNPDLFDTQLRAILRAAVEGDIRILLPMVTSLVEVRRAREAIQRAYRALEARGQPAGKHVPVGIMVEVPSAAIIADILAPEVDFFSIGTNDLVQYSLAVDRGNETVAELYQPAHPAVLRLLARLIEQGARAGIPVNMCGEMSADVVYTVLLLGLGLRTMSVTPGAIPEIKKVVRSITMREARRVAAKALTLPDGDETNQYLTSLAREIIPQMFGDFQPAEEG